MSVDATTRLRSASDRRGSSSRVRALCADGALLSTCAFVVTLFIVSPLLLEHYGVPYITPGGGPASKFHPATFLALLALLLRCLSTEKPAATAMRLLTRDRGIVVLSAAICVTGLFAAVVSHTPVTPVVDTFVLPILCLVLLRDLDPKIRRWLALFVIAILCVNALMAIVEMFRGMHFITVPIGDDTSADPTRSDTIFDWRAEINSDWRATALLGHPLVNGMEIATFIVCLGARGASWLPSPLRIGVLALQLVSMGTFGARASLVLTIAALLVFAAASLLRRRHAARPIPPHVLAIGMILAAAALIGALTLYETGFFDRLIQRFTEDAGSAKTRLTMFDLFTPFDWSALLLGPDPDVVATWQRMYGLEFGIESSWIGLLLTYGIIVTAILLIGLAAFVRSVLRASGQGAGTALAVFFVCTSVMASMSGKTISFGMAVTIVLLLLPRQSIRQATRPSSILIHDDATQAAFAPKSFHSRTEKSISAAARYSHRRV